MSLSRADLNKAFREAASYEFREIPRNDALIQYEFSVGFEQRMEALLKKEKKLSWRMFNTAAKRAVIVATLLVMMLTTACAVPSIREPLVEFVKEIFETHILLDFDREGPDVIEEEYYPTFIPSGYEEEWVDQDEGYLKIYYKDEDGNRLDFTQSTGGAFLALDTEHSELKNLNIAGREVELHIAEYSDNDDRRIITAIWIENSYLMEVGSHGTLDEATVIKIIEGIAKKEG